MFADQVWLSLIYTISYCGFYGLAILLLCPHRNERVCRASWKYELTKGRGLPPSTSLYPTASGKAWVKSFFSFISLSFSINLSPVLYFSISPFSCIFFYPLIQQLTLHTQAQTDISIHVLPPRSPATLTNGSMQLACTHSKRSFEYSSANSCIHWYLKCSGFARALSSMVRLTQSKKIKILGTRIKTAFIVKMHQYPSFRLACICIFFPLRKWKHKHYQSFFFVTYR